MTYFSKTPPTSSIHSSSSLGAPVGLGVGRGVVGGTGGELTDFGHSLMAGLGEKYMPHFVLHGTSQSFDEFKDQLVSDLSGMIKVIIHSNTVLVVIMVSTFLCIAIFFKLIFFHACIF